MAMAMRAAHALAVAALFTCTDAEGQHGEQRHHDPRGNHPLRGNHQLHRQLGRFATPDWGYYHKTDEVFSLIEAYGTKCPMLVIQRISDEVTAPYTVKDTMVCTATDPSVPDVDKIPMLVVFGEHARELISSEIALRLVAMLCSPTLEASGGWTPADAKAVGGPVVLGKLAAFHQRALGGLAQYDMSPASVSALLKRIVYKFVPLENLNGRRMVEEQGKLCHRMNGRGVDINRNYDNHFGVHAPEYLPSEEYEGTAAASEPETRITRDIAAALKPLAFISIHSGIREMYRLPPIA
jgi:hypothetical protein